MHSAARLAATLTGNLRCAAGRPVEQLELLGRYADGKALRIVLGEALQEQLPEFCEATGGRRSKLRFRVGDVPGQEPVTGQTSLGQLPAESQLERER